MIEELKRFYKGERIEQTDPDFLEFEEEKISGEDLNLVLRLLKNKREYEGKLDNPHNSIILYITELSDQFDFEKARGDMIDGSPPDVDLDISPLRRMELIDWLIEHRGRENTAQIGTYGTFKPRSIVRRYCSIREKSDTWTAELLKMIPRPDAGKEPTLEQVIEAAPAIATEQKYKELYELAQVFEDMSSTSSIHAAGVVFTDYPISEWCPVALKEVKELDKKGKTKKKKTWVTQLDMGDVEENGVLKVDLLVIDNLDVISECLRLIKERHGKEIDIYKIEDYDEKAYRIINLGLLSGILQLETSGVTWELIKRIQPSSIQEISDVTGLIRPGPRKAHMDEQYCDNEPDALIPQDVRDLELWQKTRGVMVYQENLMQLFNETCGWDLVQTDLARKAVGEL